MRYRVKKTKLARVYHLPVTSRLQRSDQQTVRIDMSEPLTREGLTAAVYQLTNAWGYMMVFEGDIAQVHAMVEPLYASSGELFFVVPNLPMVVNCLLSAGRQPPQD